MIHETYKMTVLSPKEMKNTCLQYLKNVYLRLVMPNLHCLKTKLL